MCYKCTSLTTVTFTSSSTTSINQYAFYGCTNLNSIKFSTGLKTIGEYSFAGTKFTSFTIPDSVTTIGNYVFGLCSSLGFITFGSGVSIIGVNPIMGCSSLTSVTFKSSSYFIYEDGMILTKDKTRIISYLQTKTETVFIFLPDELTTIRESAFEGNQNLQMIVIPMNVTKIENSAFYGCTKLTHV